MRKQAGVILMVLLGFVNGCASGASEAAASRKEPGIIAIRNTSGREAKSIVIEEDKAGAGTRRVGSMSPVLQNYTHTYIRPTNAPRLPEKLRVTFSFADGAEHSTFVDIRPTVRQFTGEKNEALVFELKAGGLITAYLDHVEP